MCPIFVDYCRIVIILALVLPATFWWFALAGGLIAAGIWINRCC